MEDSSLDLADLMFSDDSKEELFLVAPVVDRDPTVHIMDLPPEVLQKKVHNAIISSLNLISYST